MKKKTIPEITKMTFKAYHIPSDTKIYKHSIKKYRYPKLLDVYINDIKQTTITREDFKKGYIKIKFIP